MNYLVKVGNKEVIVKPYAVKTIIDDIVIFDYIYDLDQLEFQSNSKENFNYNIIKNVKGLLLGFV